MLYAFLRLLIRLASLVAFQGRTFGARNVPASSGVMLAANHQSFLDPLLVGMSSRRPVHFMARSSLFERSRFFAALLYNVNAFPVRRDRADMSAVKEALRRLRDGAAILVFPEGTRTHDGTVGEFKSGVFMIAARAGVSVVPTAIEGAFDSWPRKSLLPRPRRIAILYGKPLDPRDFAGDIGAMSEACRAAIIDLQARGRARLKGVPHAL